MTTEPGEHLTLTVTGRPTAEEVAALTAVVAVRLAARQTSAPRPAAGPAPSSGWLDRAALTRAPLRPGRDAWRRSGRPA